ncbi:MAG: electron transport complex subunit RsxC [Eubacterium sp.]|nr:electron transport complex subunit RsxC [Eubacterium sp.]
MIKFSFRGGIHPDDGKKLTQNEAVRAYVTQGEAVYPLSQHIGAPAKPVVKKGDRVLAGQLIAEAAGFVSANIHSAVSGTVKAIEKRNVPAGGKMDSIVIENDGLFESVDFSENVRPLSELYREDVIAIIRKAGVVGMGGAGFPTDVKLSPRNEDAIDCIIVNGAECEPYLTSDYRRMLEEPEKIVDGLKIALGLFQGAQGIIAIEDNKPEAIKNLREKTKDEPRIRVNKVKTKYPQGAERQLIYANTGRYVNSNMLPADAGCIVHNVDTIISIYEAVIMGCPVISRVVTVTGDCIAEPRNFIVPIGTSFRELVEAAGGFKKDPAKVIAGGPMMGKALYDLDVPVTKGTSAILALSKDAVADSKPSQCIKCGKCVSVCPGRVEPNLLADLAEAKDIEGFLKYNGMECCECGCCSYVCPAKRHLTQTIAGTRKQVLANRKRG